MRKVNYLFSMLMLFFMGGVSMNAADVYNLGEQVTTAISPGVDYILAPSGAGGSKYLTATFSLSTTLTAANVFQFEAAGTKDGLSIYVLKNKSTGAYVSRIYKDGAELNDAPDGQYMDDIVSSTLTTTTDVAKAMQFFVEKGDSTAAQKGVSRFWYGRTSSYYSDATMADAFVIANANSTKIPPVMMCGGNGQFMSGYTDTNIWQIYALEVPQGIAKLTQILRTYLPDGVEAAFTEGSAPGMVPTTQYQALKTAYDNVNTLLNSTETHTAADYDAASNALVAAYNAAKAAVLPMMAGVYYIQNVNNSNLAYDDVTSGTMKHASVANFATALTQETKYIFQLTAASDTTFYIQDLGTGSYVSGYADPLKTSATDKIAFSIFKENGTWAITLPTNKANGWNRFSNGTIGTWTVSGDAGSHWNLITVPDSIKQGISERAAQEQLNAKLAALYPKASNIYETSRTFKSDATADNTYTSRGLITDAANLWTNSLASGDGQGLAGLVDGDFTTYYHSSYTAATAPTTPSHAYIGMNLGKQVSTIQLKMSKRTQNMNGANPTQLAIYATNDTTGTWTFVKNVAVNYTIGNPDTTAITTGIELGAPYQYVRMDVLANANNQNVNGLPFFYLSELAAYEATYDAANSPLSKVPEAITTALVTNLKAAATEVAANKATQPTIDALQKAYDDFVANYPDPQVAKDALAALKVYVDGAAAGDGVGYTTTEGLAAIQGVYTTESAKIADVMDLATVNAVKTNCANAITAFLKTIKQPSANTLYAIVSKTATTAKAGGAQFSGVYAQNNNIGTGLKWGGINADSTAFDKTAVLGKPAYMWEIETADNDSVYLRNVGTGFYMNGNTTSNVAGKVYIKYSGTAGVFNLIVAKTGSIYLNAQPGTGKNMVTWTAAAGNDNSAYEFQAITLNEDEATFYQPATAARTYQLMTVPYEVAGAANGDLYKVLGQNADKNQLVIEKTTSVAAGVPFIFKANDATATSAQLYPVVTPTHVATVGTATTQNGVVGVLSQVNVKAGEGVLVGDGSQVTLTTGLNTLIAANTGYFTEAMPIATGTVTIPIAAVVDAINEVTTGAANNNYYDLQGRRVLAPTKGLYIVGGKKVIIK